MPGIHCDLIRFRNDPVNAERLIPGLAFFHNGGNCFRSGTFLMIEYQIGSVHVSVLSIRSGHFVVTNNDL